MSDDVARPPDSPVLSRWGRATTGLCLGTASLLVALEAGRSGADLSLAFLAVVGFVLVLESGALFLIATQTHRGAGLEPLTLATWVTLSRAAAIAVLAGFVVVPSPPEALAWGPAGLFTIAAALDAVDGPIARRTGTVTELGGRLDVETDALVVLVGALVAVRTGAVPLAFLAVGLARYLFVLGRWWRDRRGRRVLELPESRVRRPLGAIAMATVWIALLPPIPDAASRTVALVVLVPFVCNFVRDWLAVTGRRRA